MNRTVKEVVSCLLYLYTSKMAPAELTECLAMLSALSGVGKCIKQREEKLMLDWMYHCV